MPDPLVTMMFHVEHADVAQRTADMLDGSPPAPPKDVVGKDAAEVLVVNVSLRNLEAMFDEVAA